MIARRHWKNLRVEALRCCKAANTTRTSTITWIPNQLLDSSTRSVTTGKSGRPNGCWDDVYSSCLGQAIKGREAGQAVGDARQRDLYRVRTTIAAIGARNSRSLKSCCQLRPMSEHLETPLTEVERNLPITHAAGLVAVRPTAEIITRQQLPSFVGISAATAGAKGISMNLVSIPPGGAAIPHFHRGFETAIYIIKGRVETRYGLGLRHSIINQAGDFLYIPADLPHQPINLSKSEPALAIVSRNDPNEQESVVHYQSGEET
jgi:uncharacterized RmlC-like cupin family protein